MYGKHIRYITYLALITICFSGCFLEDALKPSDQPNGQKNLLSIYFHDSTYAFKENIDTVNSINTCFRCFKPGTKWSFYYYYHPELSASEGSIISSDTIEVILDSNFQDKQFFSYTKDGVKYDSFVYDSTFTH
jgi:hypothetical protein